MLWTSENQYNNEKREQIDKNLRELVKMLLAPYGLGDVSQQERKSTPKKIMKAIKVLERKLSPNGVFELIIDTKNEFCFDEMERKTEERTIIWVLMLLLHYYRPQGGRILMSFRRVWEIVRTLRGYNDRRDQMLSDIMDKWNLDRSIYLEMLDTIETYISLDRHRRMVKWWQRNVKQELEKTREELNSSVKALLELG